jgi:hypothetical protein
MIRRSLISSCALLQISAVTAAMALPISKVNSTETGYPYSPYIIFLTLEDLCFSKGLVVSKRAELQNRLNTIFDLSNTKQSMRDEEWSWTRSNYKKSQHYIMGSMAFSIAAKNGKPSPLQMCTKLSDGTVRGLNSVIENVRQKRLQEKSMSNLPEKRPF